MIHLYLKLMLSIVLVFLLLSLAARALGTTQPPNPTLLGFIKGCEDKPQPCWYGIVPGITAASQAMKILNDAGFQVNNELVNGYVEITAARPLDTCEIKLIFFEPGVDNKVNAAQIIGCLPLNLGEIINAIGQPDSFGICGGRYHHWLMLSYRVGKYIEIRTQPQNQPIKISDNISLYSEVHDFKLSPLTPGEPSTYSRVGWLTAAPMWLYGRRSEIAC